jgi:SAM-dependent methyltransferase
MLATAAGPVPSFVEAGETNLDRDTVRAFGREWQRFSEFTDDEIARGGREYFEDLLPDAALRGARVLDVGCGSGRWTRYLAARAAFVEAADPSDAAGVAARATAGLPNVRVVQAGVASLPYPDASFDIVVSVGVLHHVPDTQAAVSRLVELLRPGGLLYLYLYYALDGRPWSYRAAFHASRTLRAVISRLPGPAKVVASDVAAVTIYWPLITLARTLRRVRPGSAMHERVPLHYYADKPWKIVRNDALDRLGTPLERRFTRAEVAALLRAAGLEEITFGERMPRWRVRARKAARLETARAER